MPASTEKQRNLFGAALAVKRGESEPISKKVADIAKKTTEKELEKMASKPKKKKQNEATEDGAIQELYAVVAPYPGCTPDSLVKPIDPLNGISGTEISPDQVHGVYPSADQAMMIAEAMCAEYQEGQKMLEEKKDKTTDKLKKAIDKLEKKRKTHMDAMKDDPKSASEHKASIADLATKIDEYLTKLEKIEKSKKALEKETESKGKKEEKVNESTINEYSQKDLPELKKMLELLKEIETMNGKLFYLDIPTLRKWIASLTNTIIGYEKAAKQM